ncbi:pseudouridine synthase [Breznakiellaceae bacterium SP9]
MNAPFILEDCPDYAVLYKPPRMHTAPLKKEMHAAAAKTLLDWYAAEFPAVRSVAGKQPWEGGLVHRLDYETRGLLLVAKTQDAMDAFLTQQREGRFVKEYHAQSIFTAEPPLPGFPDKAAIAMCYAPATQHSIPLLPLPPPPFSVQSSFRAFGPGRKAVRPFMQDTQCLAAQYETEIAEYTQEGKRVRFRLRLRKGFRHQIRCHLSWLGYPIMNDPLYGGANKTLPASLALCADFLSFIRPGTGERIVIQNC